MKILVETSLTSCFVAPAICKQLVDAGLSPKVPFQWKIRNSTAELCTYEFDLDDYYREGIRHQDFINPPGQILPAYNIKDVEKLLPAGYLLTMNDRSEYEVFFNNIFPFEACIADRMPDVFAMMLLRTIKRHAVDLNKINLILSR